MLAQQREIQLKKRQSSLAGGILVPYLMSSYFLYIIIPTQVYNLQSLIDMINIV